MNQEIDIEINESVPESSLDGVSSSSAFGVNESAEFDSASYCEDDCINSNKTQVNKNVYLLNLEYSNERFYAFAPDDISIKKGDFVVVPTRYGVDIARVCSNKIPSSKVSFRDEVSIIRLAEEEDFDKCKDVKNLEAEAGVVFKEKVRKHNLSMKFITCHFLIIESKMLFFFSSDSRVDFRLLVRDLVSIFKMRVELRQIGVRDETRFIGGIAPCGRKFCCNSIADRMEPVSIKMAKDEGLSLNSNRISGHCGRLLCCLAYEHKHYVELNKSVPYEGCKILYDGEMFRVKELNKTTMIASLSSESGEVINIPISRFKKIGNTWKII